MSSDCLVLLLEDDSMKLYIIYDNIRQIYCIWGKATATDKATVTDKVISKDKKKYFRDYEPFYFSCDKKDTKQLYCFIEFVMDFHISVSLYNYNDLPNGCSEITFPLLEEFNTEEKIISY